jgi:hypothetical protein
LARNHIPTNSTRFSGWLTNFVTRLTAHAEEVGLVPADLTPISDADGSFGAALADFITQRRLAHAAAALKTTEQREAMAILRPLIQRVCTHPGMTDELRGLLGLGRDDLRQSPVPIKELPAPGLYLEASVGVVTIHWGPNPRNERSNGKPPGVKGCNIYRKKRGEEAFTRLEYVTSSPYYDPITGPAADYTYFACYRGSKPNELGRQSAEQTIAARGVLAA